MFIVFFQEIFNDAQEPYKSWTATQICETVLERGNKLEMPDWAGSSLCKLVINDIFEVDPTKRISMADVVKRMEKIAPA